MRKGFLLAAAVWLAVAGLCPAQSPSGPIAPGVYGNIEYLLFWIKDGPNRNPLLTTSPASGTGILGGQGTRTLFGGDDLHYGTFSGVRGTLGAWLDEDATFGLEGGGFILDRRADGIAARSNPDGTPVLALPAFFVNLNQENSG